MRVRLRTWGRGILEAFLALTIFTVALGVCLALLLLLISIEEGGSSLSAATVPLTETVLLLTQGCGFTAGSLTLTIIPLLLSISLLWLIEALVTRLGLSIGGCILGTLTWIVMNMILQGGTQTVQLDTSPLIIAKTGLFFLLGYGIALVRSDTFREWWSSSVSDKTPYLIRRSVRLGVSCGAILLGIFLTIGLITLICWMVLYRGAVDRLFHLARMGRASSILTSIASLAWLPNLLIWAFSWLMADGFSIGELASFTLWSGHAKSLPALPLFGIFPDPVNNPSIRTLLLNIPLITGFLIGIIQILISQRHRLATFRKQNLLSLPVLKRFLAATFSMALTWSIGVAGSATLFFLSNGSLGTQRLASVGVSIPASTRMIALSLGTGFMTSWVLVILAAALAVAWYQIIGAINHQARVSDMFSESDDHDPGKKTEEKTNKSSELEDAHENRPRRVSSSEITESAKTQPPTRKVQSSDAGHQSVQ